jgi:hypothetical protein
MASCVVSIGWFLSLFHEQKYTRHSDNLVTKALQTREYPVTVAGNFGANGNPSMIIG